MTEERAIVIREPMLFHGSFKLHVTEYPPTTEGSTMAGKKLRKESYGARHVSVVTGQGALFLNSDFIALLRDAARRRWPVIDFFFHSPSLLDSGPDEEVKAVANPIEVMLKEIEELYEDGDRGSEAGEAREVVHSAIQAGVLRLYLLRERVDTPHSAILDNSKVFIQQKHSEDSQEFPMYWFVENAIYLLRKYRAQHDRIRQAAATTPLCNDVHRRART